MTPLFVLRALQPKHAMHRKWLPNQSCLFAAVNLSQDLQESWPARRSDSAAAAAPPGSRRRRAPPPRRATRSRAGSVSARPADRVYIEEVNIAKATEKASTCFTSPGEEPNLDPETREARNPRKAAE